MKRLVLSPHKAQKSGCPMEGQPYLCRQRTSWGPFDQPNRFPDLLPSPFPQFSGTHLSSCLPNLSLSSLESKLDCVKH